MKEVLRTERKFLMNKLEAAQIYGTLDQLLLPDEHNGAEGYIVRSLYFDTVYDGDYYEKADGLEIRRKIRLRIYDPSNQTAFLEIKQKQGTNQLKRSLPVKRQDAIELTKGNYECLRHYTEPFAEECYALMLSRLYMPKTIVQYNRKAYIAKENKIRITFDSNIVSTESSMDIFDDRLNMNPVLDPFGLVLEVKYNGFLLSYIKELLKPVDKSEISVSKYVLARQNGCLTRL